MIVSVEGGESTGKSSLALTAPLPLVMFSFDMGHNRGLYGKLFPQFVEGKKVEVIKYRKPKVSWVGGNFRVEKVEYEPFEGNDITVYELPSPIQMDINMIEGYIAQWAYFQQLFVSVMQSDTVQTVAVDTMTLCYRNKCDAYLEEMNVKSDGNRKQLIQIEYGRPNEGIRNIYQYAKAIGKNMVVTHHLRDHYVQVTKNGQLESVADGTLETDGIRDTARYVDISLRNTKKGAVLTSTFQKCGENLDMEGKSINNATWDRVMNMVEVGWHGPAFPRREQEVDASV
jgi:hypothetical protein